MTKADYIKIITGVLLIFGLVMLYVSELFYVSHTIGIWLYVLLVGFGLAILAIYTLRSTINRVSLFERMMIVVATLMISAMLAPGLTSLMNRATTQIADYKRFDLVKYEKRSPQAMGLLNIFVASEVRHVLHVREGHKNYVFSLPAGSDFVVRDHEVDILMKRGLLGLNYPVIQ